MSIDVPISSERSDFPLESKLITKSRTLESQISIFYHYFFLRNNAREELDRHLLCAQIQYFNLIFQPEHIITYLIIRP